MSDACIRFAVVAVVAAFSIKTCPAEVRYVSASLSTGANNGTSWADAYRGRDGLARAIESSVAGDSIWVARGVYAPTDSLDRSISFIPKTGVTVLGGFLGNETGPDARDAMLHTTTLSGDLASDDAAWPSTLGRDNNSYHLIAATDATQHNGTFDGFTITAGFADTSNNDADKGAGAIVLNGAAPSFVNCRFANNRTTFGGGAIYIRSSSPALTGCTLTANNGGVYGGACDMANFCNPVWTRCIIENNTALRAGGVEVFGSSQPVFSNCLFAGNSSTGTNPSPRGGGALYIQQSTVELRSCTIVSNSSAVNGGGILNNAGTVTVSNAILWNNQRALTPPVTDNQQLVASNGGVFTTQHSIVQGGAAGSGNSALDPRFADAAHADYRLAGNSPAIDAGSNTFALGDTIDLSGRVRKVNHPGIADTGVGPGPVIDLGCYEYQPVCAADIGVQGGLAGADGLLDNNDFVVFINWFFAADQRSDRGSQGGASGSDGLFDNNDFVIFIDQFFIGCI